MREPALFWPPEHGSDALRTLARASGLAPAAFEQPPARVQPPASDEELGALLGTAARATGLDLVGVASPYSDVAELLRRASPAILSVPGRGLLLLVAGGAKTITLLGPDLGRVRRPIAWLRDLLCAPLEAPHRAALAALLDEAGVHGRRRARATQLLLAERLLGERLESIWLVRLPPEAGVAEQVHDSGLLSGIGKLSLAYVCERSCGFLAFLLLGQGTLGGRLDPGWLAGCLLLLLTALPLRAFAAGSEESLAARAGALLRRRLLSSAQALPPERLRSDGVGRLLGRVLASEELEHLLASGGLGLLSSIFSLVLAGLLLSLSGAGFLAGLLASWLAVCLGLAWHGHRRRAVATAARLELTQQLIERMVGHRTRLAQEPAASWHDAEDRALEGYHLQSAHADRAAARFDQLAGRGFFLLGLLTLVPLFVFSPPDLSSSTRLGIALWGVLLSASALDELAQGLRRLSDAFLAWQQIAPLLERREPRSPPLPVPAATATAPAGLLSAHRLMLAHPRSGAPLLRSVSLVIEPGERLLLTGPSGCGKSTLAAILAGLRAPDSGLLLLGGRDRQTLGTAAWRRRVALAPQYHENHVLTGTFAFNLLLGRAWPPSPADLDAAQALCGELGLRPLLDRMPAGLHQMLGETGWQLSQGERSRLFLARALLQDADLIILDESLAALDPETLTQVASCLLRRARALLAVVHP